MRKLGIVAELDKRINAVKLGKNTPSPKGELEEGDKVVGILPLRLKKFNVVLSEICKEMAKECADDRHRALKLLATPVSEAKPEDLAFMAQHLLLHRRVDVVSELFWQDVRESFPEIAGAPSIGLRKDWQLVTSKPKDSAKLSGLAELLRALTL